MAAQELEAPPRNTACSKMALDTSWIAEFHRRWYGEPMSKDQDKFTIVGLGEILWDLLPEGKQLGGAPANFAYHAQALGARGVPVSCVGDDDLGREILDRLGDVNLETGHIAIDRDHSTGTVSVELDTQGKPTYIIHEGVAWDFIPYDAALDDLAGQADAVCFGSLCQRSPVSRATVQRFLEATKPDCLRIYDINLRQHYYSPDIVDSMLGLSNVLKLNDEELPIVAQLLDLDGDENRILLELRQRYDLDLIVLTRGAEGSTLVTTDRVSSHKTIEPLTIADTVGAGDSFTAAVAMGLLAGRDLDHINRTANHLAAYVCTQKGAMPPVPAALMQNLLQEPQRP